jgi:WD40 repeat protein
VAAADGEYTIRLWNVTGNGERLDLEQGAGDLDWSPDGAYLLTGSSRGTMIYHITRSPLKSVAQMPFSGLENKLFDPAIWSPDGTRIATASENQHAIIIYDKNGIVSVCSGPDATYPIHAFTWSPDGKYLAGVYGNEVLIWTVSGGKILYRYRGHDNDIDTVVWSPRGNMLASSDVSGQIQVWQAETASS